ncbi:Las1 family protein [Acanthamoeba castellanii str. Neff]|uniref:Las1 family protein n=1 Tax=Acanthamoeba castellanii (strain ATCC 30010 / Neff) TaxID=1257118 RepID=L8H2H6_ACACF|nr:Las1 family protein [Acanthamoeba castellanii str. Neff]ELR19442.1 Las1 family protein [Acanthamoeba castellanii str. Neff]
MKRVRENANPTQGGQGQQGGEEPTGEPQKKLKRAEMFGGARVVGWGTWDEWRTVRAWLGSSVPEEQQRGFRRIRAWRARAPLPLAIEATAALLETHAMDTFPPTRTTNELRLLYSMAIVRMVNGLVEVEQKGTFARSVWGIAERLGLPRVLVDLRHTATHSVLPSLPSLRIAAAQALEWLDGNYWQEQEDSLTEMTDRMRSHLTRYVELKGNRTVEVPHAPGSQAIHCVTDMLESTNSNKARELLVPMLVSEFLAPRPMITEIMSLHKRQRSSKLSAEFTRLSNRWNLLLEGCVQKWGHFLGTLLATITNRIVQLSESPELTRKAETEIWLWLKWVEHLLYASSFQNLVYEYEIEVPVVALMQAAARHVSQWTNKLNGLFLSWVADPKMREKMTQLMDLTRPRGSTAEQPGALSLEVFESLLELIKQRGVTAITPVQPAGTTAHGPWARCEGWTPCSVGLSVTNEFPDLQLPPALDVNGAITLVPAERPVMPLVVLPYSAAAAAQRRMTANREEDDDEFKEAATSTTTTEWGGYAQEHEPQEEAEVQADPQVRSGPVTAAALLFSPKELTSL